MSSAGEAAQARSQALRRIGLLAVVLVASTAASPLLAMAGRGHLYAVATGSMEPAIPAGSIVVARAGPVAIGTIVVYDSVAGVPEVHRVVEIRESAAGPVYVTRGDANSAADSFLVTPDALRGVVVGHVPAVGRLWTIPLAVQVGLFVAFLVAYLAITTWDARRARRGAGGLLGVGLVLVMLLASDAGASLVPVAPASALALGIATSPIPMAGGTMGAATVAADFGNATTVAAAPKIRSEIVLWSCRATAASCAQALPALAYADEPGSRVYVAPASYAPTPTFYFEAVLAARAGQTAFAILRDRNLSLDVAGTEVSTTSTTPVLLRAGPFALATAADYGVAVKNSGLAAGGELRVAKLLVEQDPVGFGGAAAMPTLVPMSGGSETGGAGFAAPTRAARWRYDAADWDGVTGGQLSFVASVSAATVTGQVRLFDRTAASAVATVNVPSTTLTATRFAAAVPLASLVDGHEYEIELRRSAGSGTTRVRLELAHLLLHQSGFTEGVRYVDLSWQATTSTSTFTTAGFDGVFFADRERGAPVGYLEATMFGSTAGSTVSARLVDGTTGSVYSGSQVDVTGTAAARARSATIPLDGHDAQSNVEIKRSSGTGTLKHAWLYVPQVAAKTYDAALRTQTAAAGCTWTFRAELAASTNLARLDEARIQLQGSGAAVDQVIVVAGVVAQTSGAEVGVAPGATLEHIVVTDPNAAGASDLDVLLYGTCGGVRTSQRVTHRLA